MAIGLFFAAATGVFGADQFDRQWGTIGNDYDYGDEGEPEKEAYTPSDEATINARELSSEDEVLYTAKGDVILQYRDAIFYADELTYNKETQIIECPGWGRLSYKERGKDQQYEIVGERIIFNIENEAGQFENAHAIVNFGTFQHEGKWYERKWYLYGKKVMKSPNERVFHIEDGRATTCPPEYESPLYSIEAKRLTFFTPDKSDPESQPRISARNLFLKFEGVPILWLPQLTYTVREDDNKSPVQVSSGYDSQKGGFVDASVDVFRNQNLTLTPHIGYYSEHGVSMGLDGNYYFQATNITTFSGTWKTFFIEDMSRQFIQERDTKDEEGDRMFRYRFLWEHVQTFGPGAGWLNQGVLMGQIDWLSDPDVMHTFYRDDYNDNGPRDTFLDFTRPIGPDNEVSIYVVKQVNDFYSTYERLPELRHVFRKRQVLNIPVMNVPVYYESRTRMGYYHYVEDENIPGHTSYSLWRAWTDQKISAPKRFFGFLNFEPFLGLAGEVGHISQYTVGEHVTVGRRGRIKSISENMPTPAWLLDYNRFTRTSLQVYAPQQQGTYFRAIPYGGVDMSFKINRTYDFEGTYIGEQIRKYLSADSEKIRHIIEPMARIIGSGGFGEDSGVAFGADVGVRNAFQIERRGQNVDLVDMTVMFSQRNYGSGMFESKPYKRNTRYNRGANAVEVKEYSEYQPESVIGFDLNAAPFDWLNLESDMIWDLDQLNRISRATLYSNIDASWAAQRLFASPYMPRPLRGRKDEVLLTFGYRYEYDLSNLITIGSRVWLDDFTPLLSVEAQQKAWARELSRGWGFGFDLRFEAESGTLQEMEYTLYKNWKKCLDTSLSYRYRDGDNAIYATFWLTAYPSSKLQMGN